MAMNEWEKQAIEKLRKEFKAGKYDRYANAMKNDVHRTLESFCKQDAEFAQAVVQGGSFEDCMKAVAKGCGSSISDLDAYRKAVRFYFPGADVRFQMTLDLCAGVTGGEDPALQLSQQPSHDGNPAPQQETQPAERPRAKILTIEEFL